MIIKKNMLKAASALLTVSMLAASFSFAAAADETVEVGVAPEETQAAEPGSMDQAEPESPSYSVFNSGNIYGDSKKSTVIYGPGTGPYSSSEEITTAASSSSSSAAYTGYTEGSVVGSNYNSDAYYTIDLGFTLVQPAHEQGGYKVAEGSVQLLDGSWDTIDYSKYLSNGYYRLLREVTDTTGTGWYVVAANSCEMGNYTTPDGSYITELWLKKDDCTLTTTIDLNTSNTTRQEIVVNALSLLGSKYEYGSAGPSTFDCSGFVSYVMGLSNVSVSRSSSEIIADGVEVGISGIRPGDITGRSGHVGIYIGDGWFIHSSDTETGVIVDSVDVYNTVQPFTNYRNVLGD